MPALEFLVNVCDSKRFIFICISAFSRSSVRIAYAGFEYGAAD